MILWSIVSPEIILSDVSAQPIYKEAEYRGMKCIVEKVNSAQWQVVRLLTTDPKDYLRQELQPGTLVTYEPL